MSEETCRDTAVAATVTALGLTILPATTLGPEIAVIVALLKTTVMKAVDRNHAGTASSIHNAVSRVATLLAISCSASS